MARMFSTVLLIAVSVLLGGCAHTFSPKESRPIPMESVGMLGPNLSVDLINDQPLTTPQIIASIGSHTYYANYNELTDFFITYWEEELSKRGVVISSESRNKIKVKLDDARVMAGWWTGTLIVKIYLSSQDNTWTKVTEQRSQGATLPRVFWASLYLYVENALHDPEIMGKMKN